MLSKASTPSLCDLLGKSTRAALFCVVLQLATASAQQPASSMRPVSLVAPGPGLQPLNKMGFEFELPEGPSCDAHGNVFFSDQPNNQILKWDAGTGKVMEFLNPSGYSKGLDIDNYGVIMAAADLYNELWAISPYTGKHTVIFKGDSEYHSTHFLTPNKIWVSPTGWVYFTDVGPEVLEYDHLSWTEQVRKPRVYRFHPDGNELLVAADGPFVALDGIVGSPDGKVLYVSDSPLSKVNGVTYRYHILDNGALANRKVFAERGSFGMTVDQQGNVYMTASGVDVYNSQGGQVEHIDVPQMTTDIVFAGKDFKTLFITSAGDVYLLDMQVKGGCEFCKRSIDAMGNGSTRKMV